MEDFAAGLEKNLKDKMGAALARNLKARISSFY
jgi:hypothetical protein